MGTALSWWVALEALSLACVPLARLLFRSLPDRGYAFSKVLGPLVLAVLVWWSGSLSLLPVQRGTVLLLTYALIIGGLVGFRLLRVRWDMPLSGMWPAVLLTESVFTVTFVLWATIRAYNPEIEATEKPMDFAFLNASYRARTFPPEDPWLSGFSINYYYLGYLNAATLTKLVGVPTSVGFNLALATLAAQAAAAACGTVYNLAEGLRRARDESGRGWSRLGPLLAGALAAVLLLGIGNLEGLLELVRIRSWGGNALWQWVDVRELRATPPSPTWYPTDLWFWWRATRIIHTTVHGQDLDYTITEFPFFSFLLGDLHPHVMALPLVLITLGVALQILMDPEPPQFALRRPLAVLGPGTLLGALGFTNIWDLPTLSAVVLITGGLRWALVPELAVGGRLTQWAAWGGATLTSALLWYAPFYLGVVATGNSVLGSAADAASKGGPVGLWTGPGSRPLHLLLFWAPFLVASGLYLWSLAGGLPATLRTGARTILLIPLALWIGLELLAYPSFADANHVLTMVGARLWAVGPLAVALGLLGWMVIEARVGADLKPAPTDLFSAGQGNDRGHFADRSSVFATGLVAAALALLLLCELVYLRDVFNNRMNTVFKLTYQGWTFLAVASAFGLYYLGTAADWMPWRSPALAAIAALLIGAFVYVPMALFNRTDGFGRPPTLDGLAFVERSSPAQRAAVDWLWTATAGRRAVILEASGPQYSGFARMSSRTGLPTLLGWPGHESQWRGSLPIFGERQRTIDQVYQAPDKAVILPLLDQHHVTYVIVGPAERTAYPAAGLDAFAGALDVAFHQGDVTIYRVPAATEARR